MKKLHLIRHAKSSWNNGSLADIDRPLNPRGLQSCALMAEQLAKAGCSFEHVFCSPATRAQSTIENISYALSGANGWDDVATEGFYGTGSTLEKSHEITWKTDLDLYTFVMKDLMRWCQKIDDSLTEAVVVGHNAAMTDFINTVGNQHLDNLPTCGYVQLLLNIESWQDLAPNTGEVLTLLTPKMFKAAVSK